MFVAIILICVALILVGGIGTKPYGWVVLTLALIALLLTVLGPHILGK
jgi:hypothetical protein